VTVQMPRAKRYANGTRLMPNGRIILSQTRWLDDDLAGRILSLEEASDRRCFRFDSLSSVERSEISSSSFASLYQQSPVTAGGNIFLAEWFGV
jgi:hypothetical protein